MKKMVLILLICGAANLGQARTLGQASGDLAGASGDMAGASADLLGSMGNLGYQSLAFSGDVVIAVGRPVADLVIDLAIETGVIFSLAVEASGEAVQASGEAIQASGEIISYHAHIAGEVTREALQETHRRVQLRASQVKRIAILTGQELNDAIRVSYEFTTSIPPRTAQALRMIGITGATAMRDLSLAGLQWSSQYASDTLYVVVNTGTELVVVPVEELNKVAGKN